ncbi:hypothetical protein KA005_68645, partial [bacterium]|nr:hypothetical protein [bacterium]
IDFQYPDLRNTEINFIYNEAKEYLHNIGENPVLRKYEFSGKDRYDNVLVFSEDGGNIRVREIAEQAKTEKLWIAIPIVKPYLETTKTARENGFILAEDLDYAEVLPEINFSDQRAVRNLISQFGTTLGAIGITGNRLIAAIVTEKVLNRAYSTRPIDAFYAQLDYPSDKFSTGCRLTKEFELKIPALNPLRI